MTCSWVCILLCTWTEVGVCWCPFLHCCCLWCVYYRYITCIVGSDKEGNGSKTRFAKVSGNPKLLAWSVPQAHSTTMVQQTPLWTAFLPQWQGQWRNHINKILAVLKFHMQKHISTDHTHMAMWQPNHTIKPLLLSRSEEASLGAPSFQA